MWFTVEPLTGTSTSILTTGDGYKWKYMYTLSVAQKQISYQQILWVLQLIQLWHLFAVDGAINIVKIKTAGSGGTNGSHTSIYSG